MEELEEEATPLNQQVAAIKAPMKEKQDEGGPLTQRLAEVEGEETPVYHQEAAIKALGKENQDKGGPLTQRLAEVEGEGTPVNHQEAAIKALGKEEQDKGGPVTWEMAAVGGLVAVGTPVIHGVVVVKRIVRAMKNVLLKRFVKGAWIFHHALNPKASELGFQVFLVCVVSYSRNLFLLEERIASVSPNNIWCLSGLRRHDANESHLLESEECALGASGCYVETLLDPGGHGSVIFLFATSFSFSLMQMMAGRLTNMAVTSLLDMMYPFQSMAAELLMN